MSQGQVQDFSDTLKDWSGVDLEGAMAGPVVVRGPL